MMGRKCETVKTHKGSSGILKYPKILKIKNDGF
jgi:hypothetical protein